MEIRKKIGTTITVFCFLLFACIYACGLNYFATNSASAEELEKSVSLDKSTV